MPTGDQSEGVLSVDAGPPEEVDSSTDHASLFALLGEEKRLRILEALYEVEQDPAQHSRLSFSTLRRRSGVADSGQFNYHLHQLTDRLVTKRDGGYRLTTTGEQLVETLLESRLD